MQNPPSTTMLFTLCTKWSVGALEIIHCTAMDMASFSSSNEDVKGLPLLFQISMIVGECAGPEVITIAAPLLKCHHWLSRLCSLLLLLLVSRIMYLKLV